MMEMPTGNRSGARIPNIERRLHLPNRGYRLRPMTLLIFASAQRKSKRSKMPTEVTISRSSLWAHPIVLVPSLVFLARLAVRPLLASLLRSGSAPMLLIEHGPSLYRQVGTVHLLRSPGLLAHVTVIMVEPMCASWLLPCRSLETIWTSRNLPKRMRTCPPLQCMASSTTDWPI